MDQKQIDQLKQDQKGIKDGAAARRALAVLLFVSKADVSLSGYTTEHAKRLRRNYLQEGVVAFKDKRTNQRDRVLTKQERERIIAVLSTNSPKDVLADCREEQWSTHLLGAYILELTGKAYKSRTSEYLLFREAKLTWHRPGRVYEKADPAARSRWVEKVKPVLQKLWDESGTVILCEDEMVLTSATTIQRVWLPRGTYPPVTETNRTRKRKSFYGFLNLKTGAQHTFLTDYQNMFITAEILSQVRTIYPTQKLVLIWDNCGWHRGSKVVEWIKADGNTEAIHFPPYTPDLNPQEHVWKEGRKHTTHNRHITKVEEVAKEFKDYLEQHTFQYELLGLRAGGVGQD